ncbi:hypothetical protein STCU_11086 [Strigomonas culicis]|uniref:Uncharacterized protein n=1 Tax=Strigomonas culicis TaxID=28005 RepID=S9UPV6_9TRYP|nr:hypothetical protein STCU_11086 [Strigomonas culicis]|eukprot:EPY16651.1 hypothetical protein STCU_11086 [Strigomonas culicis]
MEVFDYDIFDMDIGPTTTSPASTPQLYSVAQDNDVPLVSSNIIEYPYDIEPDDASDEQPRSTAEDYFSFECDTDMSTTELSHRSGGSIHRSITWLLDDSPTVADTQSRKSANTICYAQHGPPTAPPSAGDAPGNVESAINFAEYNVSVPQSGETYELNKRTSLQGASQSHSDPQKNNRSGLYTTPTAAHQQDTAQPPHQRMHPSHDTDKNTNAAQNTSSRSRRNAYVTSDMYGPGRGSTRQWMDNHLYASSDDNECEEGEGEDSSSSQTESSSPVDVLTQPEMWLGATPHAGGNAGDSRRDDGQGGTSPTKRSSPFFGWLRSNSNSSSKLSTRKD